MELLTRLKTEKPEFFKKFQRVFVTVTGLLAFFLLLLQADVFHGDWVADVKPWVIFLIAFFGGNAAGAQATTVKPELQDEKTKENVVKSLDQAEIYDIKNNA